MSKIKLLKVTFLLSAAALLLSGCGLVINSNGNMGSGDTTDGGIFKSLNKGSSWTQKTDFLGVNTKRNFSAVDIIFLTLDPSDNKAIYAGSLGNGLFYSYDGAEGWQIATGLGKVSVTNLAVDPDNKCLIYATVDNKVFKSEDCSRTWTQIYFDNDLKANISSLAIDHSSSNNIFIGTSNGDIIKSSNFGLSWKVLTRVDSQIDKIIFSPISSKIMFVGTASNGVFRSTDGGDKWENLTGKSKISNGGNHFRDLIIVKSAKAIIFLATDYGLSKSTDNGDSWEQLDLLTAEKEAKIYSIAVNPINEKEIYYTTGTTFYHSQDAGKTWIAKKLPTSRGGFKLLLDPKNPAILYLAARQVKK